MLHIIQRRALLLLGCAYVVFLPLFVFPSWTYANDVLDASTGVYRLWLTIDVTESMPANIQSGLQNQPYGTFQSDGNEMIAFIHRQKPYVVRGHGTSFAISADHLVTNHHVIEPILTDNAVGFVLMGIDNAKLQLLPITIVHHDDRKDLATIKVADGQLKPLTLADQAGIEQTLPVSSIGFPGDSDDLGGIDDHMGYFSPKIRGGILSAQRQLTGQVTHWEHDAAISGGNSGGPLVNQCGEVVGVNVAGHATNQSVLLAIALSELVSTLEHADNHTVQPSVASSVCISGITMSPWIIGVIAFIALILLALLLVVFNIRNKILAGTLSPNQNGLVKAISKSVDLDKIRQDDEEWQTDDDGRKFRFDPMLGIVYQDEQTHQDPPPQSPAPEPPSPTPEPPVSGLPSAKLIFSQQQSRHSANQHQSWHSTEHWSVANMRYCCRGRHRLLPPRHRALPWSNTSPSKTTTAPTVCMLITPRSPKRR